MIYKNYLLIHDKKHAGIKIKFYNLDTFKKQVDANCIDLDSEFVDLNYKDASLIFCHFWRSIGHQTDFQAFELCEIVLILIPFLWVLLSLSQLLSLIFF